MKAKFLKFTSPVLHKETGCFFHIDGKILIELLENMQAFQGQHIQLPIFLEGITLKNLYKALYEYINIRLPTLPTEPDDIRIECEILGKKFI
jgi:hypothetical protein